MPKIIAGLRERLLEEAERQLTEGGYGKMTIRAVARECRVAVGTVYNYFAGKEEFVAYALLARWKKAKDEITAVSTACSRLFSSIPASTKQALSRASGRSVEVRMQTAGKG